MRVSSLSDERVIRLVSRHFVPVWISRDRYQLDSVSEAEQRLIHRLDTSRRAAKLEGGAVCVYIASADGTVSATLPVQRAFKPDLLTAFLDRVVEDARLSVRSSADARAAAAVPPAKAKPTTEGGRLFTIRTRFDKKGQNRGTTKDTVELTKKEWSALFPPAGAKLGDRWRVPASTSDKLFQYGFPPHPQWRSKMTHLDESQLTAWYSGIDGSERRISLTGKMTLRFPWTGKPTDGKVTAYWIGFARLDADTRTVKSMMMVAEEAKYVWWWQGVTQPAQAMSITVEMEP